MTVYTTKKETGAFDKEIEKRKEEAAKAQQARHIAAARADKRKRIKQSQRRTSRRALIIGYLAENIWDRRTLAEALALHGYTDIKANLKAVSGTIYDLQTNRGYFYKSCDEGRIWRAA